MGARGRKSQAELSVVPQAVPPAAPVVLAAPRPLGEHGAALWARIVTEFAIEGAGTVEQLAQVCAALDRAEACAARIELDGIMVEEKEHPLIKHELGARAFVVRTLQRLGLEA